MDLLLPILSHNTNDHMKKVYSILTYQLHFGKMDCLKLFQSVSGQRFYGSHQLIFSIGDTLALNKQKGRAKLRVKDE